MKNKLSSTFLEIFAFIAEFLKIALKFLLKMLGGIVFLVGVNGINILLSSFTGLLCGWVLDVCLQKPALEFMTYDADVVTIYFQEIGTIAGLIIGFFKHDFKINLKKDNKES